MSRIVVVPDELRDEINRRLDEAYVVTPEAAIDREMHYQTLLVYFDEHGTFPTNIGFARVQ